MRNGCHFRKIQVTETISAKPRTAPMTGARTMNSRVLIQPANRIAPKPAFATAAPA